jgi:hypothetical protein
VQSLAETYQQLVAVSEAATREHLQSMEKSHALIDDFARWLGMLPDPALSQEASDDRVIPQALLELSNRVAEGSSSRGRVLA